MEPQIQYAKTEDGVNIAYYALGHGPAVVRMPNNVWSHFQLQWQAVPAQRAIAEAVAARFTHVEYDSRGAGSSTREVSDFSLDAYILDLEAVVEQLSLENFTLIGQVSAGPVAITYAVRNPQRVSHLILANSYVRYADVLATPVGETNQALLGKDWTIFTEAIAQLMTGWYEAAARQFAARARETVSQEVALASNRELEKFDVTDLLPQIQTPTLVVHDGSIWPPVESSRSLAAQIPDARLVVSDDILGTVVAVGEFLGVDPVTEEEVRGLSTGQRPSDPEGMTAILFLDIADSTALTTKLGDAAYREKERTLDASLRAAITDAGGTPVEGKVLGDGVMAVFTSARQAIEAAQRCRDLGNEAGLPLHLGIHAGDVVREGNNVHGGAIQVAARVVNVAEPGEILVSATVRDLARTSAGVDFEDRGEHQLKGIPEPQRLFAVQAAE